MEHAFAREDVARVSPADHADVQGRIGRIEARIELLRRLELARQAADFADDVAGDRHRIGAERGLGRMSLEAGDERAKRRHALMRVGDRHHRRLADDHEVGTRRLPPEPRDEIERAEAGRFFVVAEQDMDRALEPGRLEDGDHRQRDGVEALHVAGAAPVEASVDFAQAEGIAAPDLPLDRHDVGVAGEDDAARGHRPDRRQQRRLVARGVGRARSRHAETVEDSPRRNRRAAGSIGRSRCRTRSGVAESSWRWLRRRRS